MKGVDFWHNPNLIRDVDDPGLRERYEAQFGPVDSSCYIGYDTVKKQWYKWQKANTDAGYKLWAYNSEDEEPPDKPDNPKDPEPSSTLNDLIKQWKQYQEQINFFKNKQSEVENQILDKLKQKIPTQVVDALDRLQQFRKKLFNNQITKNIQKLLSNYRKLTQFTSFKGLLKNGIKAVLSDSADTDAILEILEILLF